MNVCLSVAKGIRNHWQLTYSVMELWKYLGSQPKPLWQQRYTLMQVDKTHVDAMTGVTCNYITVQLCRLRPYMLDICFSPISAMIWKCLRKCPEIRCEGVDGWRWSLIPRRSPDRIQICRVETLNWPCRCVNEWCGWPVQDVFPAFPLHLRQQTHNTVQSGYGNG